MTELRDNSGEFSPERKLEDFSKDFLLELGKLYCHVVNKIPGYWWYQKMDLVSSEDKDMIDTEARVWFDYFRDLIPRHAELANIKLPVTSVLDGLKIIQTNPDGYTNPEIYWAEFFVRTPNDVIQILKKCAALELVEVSMPDKIHFMCHEIEPAVCEVLYGLLGPGMRFDPIQLPPRDKWETIDKNAYCCVWEAHMEPKDGGVEVITRTKEEEIPGELPDNSGPFNPKRVPADFSKDFLIRMEREHCLDCMMIMMYCHNATLKVADSDRTTEIEIGAWRALNEDIVPLFAQLANINLPVSNALDAIKVVQILWDGYADPRLRTPQYEIKSPNDVVITCTHCGTLGYFEQQDPDRIVPFCQKVEPAAFESRYKALNPNFEITPVKLPPRQSKDEIACQWELSLKS